MIITRSPGAETPAHSFPPDLHPICTTATHIPGVESELFAPSGFVASARDKEVQAMWDQREAETGVHLNRGVGH